MRATQKDAEKAANEFTGYEINDDHSIFIKGFLAGCEFEAQNNRDFYLLVREYFKHDHFRMHDEHEALYNKIQKHLAAFTSRELESLPFKD